MRYYPAFVDTRGTRIVFLGSGEGLANKLRLLGKSEASCEVFGENLPSSVRSAATDTGAKVISRDAAKDDLVDAKIIYVDEEDTAKREALIVLARGTDALVNVVDYTEACDFITPALVERGPLTIAISSDGAAPALARRVKAQLERFLPHNLGAIGALVHGARDALKAAFPSPDARRRFLDKLFDGGYGAVTTPSELSSAIVRAESELEPEGRIAIVGAGPGDPELLTIKAHRALQAADVIVHDKLVSDDILDLARRDADRIYVGKSRANHSMAQQDISQLLVTLARQGKYVVRLKGGDPFIFGRGGEELDVAEAAGVAVEVVPGISAALGCAAASAMPLTHRDHASAVTLVAGQRRDLGAQNWSGLAGPGRTLVIYMGVSAAGDIASKLQAEGIAHDMPVAILENGTRREARTLHSTLENLALDVTRSGVKSPALIVVGDVAAEDRSARLEALSAQIVPFKQAGAAR